MKLKNRIIVVGMIILTTLVANSFSAFAQQMTRKECIEAVKKAFGVKFVYDSTISLDTPYRGRTLGQVTDKSPKAEKISLEQCLDRLFRGSGIEWSKKGNHIILKKSTAPVVEKETEPLEFTVTYAGSDFDADADTLNASSVSTDRMKLAARAQTGLIKISKDQINSGFAIFNSPDVIKTLQRLPGVASGTELLSGLYVHGGTGSDNLYLLDGVPLYGTSHLIGLFSSFNSDVVEDVDFYKSGFPARYGDRLSSVVDVNTREGNMHEWHGTFSLGLIDGRFQIEGPLVKGKTSINAGLRRTWLDTFSVPALWYANAKNKKYGDKYKGNYAFWDVNFGITHKISDSDKLQLNFFNGMDNLKIGYREAISKWDDALQKTVYFLDKTDTDTNIGLAWGSTTAGLSWKHVFSDFLSSKTTAYFARNLSSTKFTINMFDWDKEMVNHDIWVNAENDRTVVNDIALKTDFDWRPWDNHHVRLGASFENHLYYPDRNYHTWIQDGQNGKTTEGTLVDSHSRYVAQQATIYAEDEITIGKKLTLQPGFRYSAFFVDGAVHHAPDPRLAMRYDLTDAVAFKASYTRMHQFVHLLQTIYVDLPTSSWMPSTAEMKPMVSSQVAGGVYTKLPHNIRLDVEGFYKTLNNIYEYDGPNSIFPPIEKWETSFAKGQGKSYGAEMALGWKTENTDLSLSYTLSWSKRFFPTFYHEWYLDRNDNRHMLNLSASHKFSNKFEIYAGWTYRTGTRTTIADQGVIYGSFVSDEGELKYQYNDVFTSPNNMKLPDYHRLDVGMNFRKVKKNGHERIWNLSCYNAYSRLNPIMGTLERDYRTGNYYGRYVGIIPIVPTASYTLKF
ncbi:MAG: TonB-dependent receptor [Bacteroidales bacterium]|nr:TonB-dependent receptor [Bacteroidales bacterium]